MDTSEEGEGKTFDLSFALTGKEIELFTSLVRWKQTRIASFQTYFIWLLIAGLALSFAGGGIAHSYYQVPLDYGAIAVFMAVFCSFYAGAAMYRSLADAWHGRVSAWVIHRLKEAVRAQMSKDGIALTWKKSK